MVYIMIYCPVACLCTCVAAHKMYDRKKNILCSNRISEWCFKTVRMLAADEEAALYILLVMLLLNSAKKEPYTKY